MYVSQGLTCHISLGMTQGATIFQISLFVPDYTMHPFQPVGLHISNSQNPHDNIVKKLIFISKGHGIDVNVCIVLNQRASKTNNQLKNNRPVRPNRIIYHNQDIQRLLLRSLDSV